MPIEWKKTPVEHEGRIVTVTHWAKHDPVALIGAISTQGFSIGKHPPLYLTRFGKRSVFAVRVFPRDWEVSPSTLFHRLRKMADNRTATVETPVAFIPDKYFSTIVTLWKKRTGPLDDLLELPTAPLSLKVKAAVSAMRQVAKLNAIKIAHGHLHTSNFVVDENGNARIIDYSLLGNSSYNEEFPEGKDSLPHLFSRMIYDRKDLDSVSKQLKLRQRLITEYEAQLERSRERNKRRGIGTLERLS